MMCIVFGVPGVGKTTVLEKAKKMCNAEIVNFGDIMFESAKKDGMVKNRDEMRKMKKDLEVMYQKRAADIIYSQSRDKNILLDTHASIKTPIGYLPGLPEQILRTLNPYALVLIECDAKSIAARRSKDKSRERDEQTIRSIEEHQFINRAYATAYSTLTTSTIMIAENAEGKADVAGAAIANIFK